MSTFPKTIFFTCNGLGVSPSTTRNDKRATQWRRSIDHICENKVCARAIKERILRARYCTLIDIHANNYGGTKRSRRHCENPGAATQVQDASPTDVAIRTLDRITDVCGNLGTCLVLL